MQLAQFGAGIFRLYCRSPPSDEELYPGPDYESAEVEHRLSLLGVEGAHVKALAMRPLDDTKTLLRYSTWGTHLLSLDPSDVPQDIPPSWNEAGDIFTNYDFGWSTERIVPFPFHEYLHLFLSVGPMGLHPLNPATRHVIYATDS